MLVKQDREKLLQRGQFLINRGLSLIRFHEMWPVNLKEGEKLLKTGSELLRRAEEMKADASETKVKNKTKEDVKDLNKEIRRIKDVEILSVKADTRAVQGISAGVPDSITSDPEIARVARKMLEDRRLGRIIAPGKIEGSRETSEDKIKAEILDVKVREGIEAKVPGYNAEQPATILSDKVEKPNTESKQFKIHEKILSGQAEELKDQAMMSEIKIKILSAKAEKIEVDDRAKIKSKDSAKDLFKKQEVVENLDKIMEDDHNKEKDKGRRRTR